MSSSSSESGDSDDEIGTPPEPESRSVTLPPSSKDKYMAVYKTFITWKDSKDLDPDSFSEAILMTYFVELNTKVKPSTLWSHYSMLKSTLMVHHDVDVGQYAELLDFIKKENEGFVSTKAKELASEDIQRFLSEAPDLEYLVTKVVLIFGITGGCRASELTNLTLDSIENHGRLLLVKMPTRQRNKGPRNFVIEGEFYDIVKRYEALRPAHATTNRFFLNYQRGKCTSQVIGKNKISRMPKQIARFLELPDANSYTGHSFHRTSKVIGHATADLMSITRRDAYTKEYADDSLSDDRRVTGNAIPSPRMVPSSSCTEDIEYDTPKAGRMKTKATDSNYEPTMPPSKRPKTQANVIAAPPTSTSRRPIEPHSEHEVTEIKCEEVNIPESTEGTDHFVDEFAGLNEDTNYYVRPQQSSIHVVNHSPAADSSGSSITIPGLNKNITFKNCTNVTIHIHNHHPPRS